MELFSPVLLRGKLLIQELWKRGVEWDEEIEDIEIQNQWTKLKKDLENVSDYKVERNISIDYKDVRYTLLCFCDASKRSYSAAVNLHQESAN
ncbi:hypothetical protein DPMN_062958 [Dreissena polymorpha]|uniref:Uncharacterized protein n=1 Tax=Dreissena polymorpha TaxID=45954 RepID=A0A9D4HI69_DREPO|nr:hypothetical protein DPMN_062958 [Dreissena polymorpha]